MLTFTIDVLLIDSMTILCTGIPFSQNTLDFWDCRSATLSACFPFLDGLLGFFKKNSSFLLFWKKIGGSGYTSVFIHFLDLFPDPIL